MENKFYNKQGQEIKRQPCEIYTRVMGYLSPVSRYNIGKKSEFYSRKYFEESKVDNSAFIRKFNVNCGCPCGM
ncbi:MAG: anaerobic ribonucleoside-triphosphate reductase [Candidatus Peribacteria bacterium]|nr:anaerobic ribonucleoside-triphosphate reductase [Candidatus Peribacteria bacterium]